jgi:outer membrane protein TolC
MNLRIRFLFRALGLCVLASASLSAADGAAEAAAAGQALRLDEAAVVERVRAQNLNLLIGREEVRRALEAMYQARAALLPSLQLQARQTRSKLTRAFTGEVFDPAYVNRFDAQVTGSQTLFDVERFADWRIARLESAIARLDYEVAEQDVLAQAQALFYTHLRDLRAVELSEGTIRRNEELRDLAVDQFEAGVATRIDVTRAEVELARARRQLLQDRTNAADSALRLKVLLDINPDQSLVFDRGALRAESGRPDFAGKGGRRTDSLNRPEIAAQRERLVVAEEARRAARLQRLPQAELFGEWGYASEEAFDGDEGEAWLVGLRLSMPVFEGFRIAAELREARAAVRQNEYRLRDFENQVGREFDFALVNLESRHAQIAIAGEEERLACDELDLALERYREGLADNRELIDAQQRLDEAEDAFIQAVFLYHLSRIDFARAVGRVESAAASSP